MSATALTTRRGMNIVSVFVINFLLPLCIAVIPLVLTKKGRGWTYGRKALLSAGIFFLAFFVSTFVPTGPDETIRHWAVAGTVEDEATREGIRQADVLLEGFNSPYKTEDNGNFRIALKGKMRNSEPVRIRVSKAGYKPYDVTLTPPKDNLIVLLEKL
jgi:hypothetical protein